MNTGSVYLKNKTIKIILKILLILKLETLINKFCKSFGGTIACSLNIKSVIRILVSEMLGLLNLLRVQKVQEYLY